MRFRETLRAEWDRRRADRPTYSLRRFALLLGVHHATVARLLQGSGPVPERTIHRLATRVGIAPLAAERMCAMEREDAVLGAVGRPGFRPDTRWLASTSGIPIDQINITLQTLLRTGRLRMVSERIWITERRAS